MSFFGGVSGGSKEDLDNFVILTARRGKVRTSMCLGVAILMSTFQVISYKSTDFHKSAAVSNQSIFLFSKYKSLLQFSRSLRRYYFLDHKFVLNFKQLNNVTNVKYSQNIAIP